MNIDWNDRIRRKRDENKTRTSLLEEDSFIDNEIILAIAVGILPENFSCSDLKEMKNDLSRTKKSTKEDTLINAGALILAELERLERLKKVVPQRGSRVICNIKTDPFLSFGKEYEILDIKELSPQAVFYKIKHDKNLIMDFPSFWFKK